MGSRWGEVKGEAEVGLAIWFATASGVTSVLVGSISEIRVRQ